MKVGAITLMTALLLALPAFAGPPDPCLGHPDTDSDGFTDPCDNCLNVPNPLQWDCDSDGCGNRCDGDFNNDGFTAAGDFSSLLPKFGPAPYDCEFDLNEDGFVAAGDFSSLLPKFGSPAGPSGTTSGTTACP